MCQIPAYFLILFCFNPAATKRVSFADPLVSSPSSLGMPQNGPGTAFLPGEEVFARPGPAAPSQPPQMRYPPCQRAPPKRLDLRPLLLPAETRARGEPCGEQSTLLVTVKPVGWIAQLYNCTIVQYLYISCYVFSNKPVLSYLLLHLLPQSCNSCTDAIRRWSGLYSDPALDLYIAYAQS
jgi:hypothetical protein